MLLFIISSIVFLLLLFVLVLYRRLALPNFEQYVKIIYGGFFLKILATILYFIIYKYYYGYGDTLRYFLVGEFFGLELLEHPNEIFDFFTKDAHYIVDKYYSLIKGHKYPIQYYNDTNVFISKVVVALGPVTLLQYLPTAFIFSMISFMGCLSLSKSMSKLYPRFQRQILIICLFIPSVVFWASGINKDSLATGFLFLLISSTIELAYFRPKSLKQFLIFLLCAYFIIHIKSYLFILSFPFLIFLYLNQRFISTKWYRSKILRFFSMISLVFGSLFILIIALKTFLPGLIESQFIAIAKINLGQQTAQETGDSSFDIGITLEDLANPLGLVRFAPGAIFTTLFRPFLWEVRNPLMLISAFETFILTIASLYLLIKVNIVKILRYSFQDKLLLSFIAMVIILAIPIGISSGNFGTIVRYKTPILPLFVSYIYLLLQRNAEKKNT